VNYLHPSAAGPSDPDAPRPEALPILSDQQIAHVLAYRENTSVLSQQAITKIRLKAEEKLRRALADLPEIAQFRAISGLCD
jgi:hypothetical protein